MPLTALAPSAFMKKIVRSLCLHEPVTTELSLNRPNIFHYVYQRSFISVSIIGCNLITQVKC